MTKIHTRAKRRIGLTRRAKHYSYFHPKGKKRRPKTFRTLEAANSWALSKGLKAGQYGIKRAKKGKRFQVT